MVASKRGLLMKRFAVLIVIAMASCGPNYESGKTQCSDKGECPSGYYCGVSGTTKVCFSKKNDSGVVGVGGAGGTGGTQTTNAGSGGSTISKTSSTGGTLGNGGSMTTGVLGSGGAASVLRDASASRDVGTADAASDLANRDGGAAGCTTTCSSGQKCLSGKCCVPPAAGGDCTVYPLCGCPTGQVCYPSSTTSAMACFKADNLAEGADCTDGSTCLAGLGCFGNICKRYCSSDSDCPSVGGVQNCMQTTWSSDNTSIAGVKVCERICDPAHPQSPTAPLLSCPTGFSCSSSTDGASYCFVAAPLATGSTCTDDVDCAIGYYCAKSGSCNRYCLSNSDCSSGTTCRFTWSPSEYAGSIMVGYCL